AKLAVAQDRLNAAKLREVAAQDRLNTLQASGKTTAAQLASAQASVASAQASVITAQGNLNNLQQTSTKQVQAMQTAFATLKSDATDSLATIGAAFVPVLTNIANTADSVLQKMTPVFASAEKIIAGPFQTFADTFIKSFAQPQVAASIKAVATAFGDILTALAPSLPGLMIGVSDAITRIANAVAKNPKAFADFIKWLGYVVIYILNSLAALTTLAAYMEQHFIPAIKHLFNFWKASWEDYNKVANSIQHGLIVGWNIFWNNTVVRAEHGWHDVLHAFDVGRHNLYLDWQQLVRDANTAWNTVWNNTVGRTIRGVQDVERAFVSLKNWVATFFSGAINWLSNAGRDIMTGLWNGIKAVWTDVENWFKGFPHAILHALGIASPPAWSISAGKNIMEGLLKGIAHGATDVKGFFLNLASNITGPLKSVWGGIIKAGGAIGGFFARLFGFHGGAGVQQWSGLVAKALSMLGLPISLAGNVLYQMQTESGGNPNAINLTDINAQMGDPSRGLLQVIGSTFAAYHVPGTS
ncbi:MAG TPA: hypothetical protein VH164_17975, partial [Ktedonobacteraceae bacterium]|nr:hypothetical protein [Ktedonobacteraceae bacterium]